MGIDGDNSDAWVLSDAFGLGSPRLTVTQDGKVGIGTNSPPTNMELTVAGLSLIHI